MFPSGSYSPIVYPIAVVANSNSTAAKALVEYLRSAPARATWERYGFAPAQ
jgi:molybdate transport system substrate-binding protein